MLFYRLSLAETPKYKWKHLQSGHKDTFSSVTAAKLACRPRSKLGQGVRKNVDYISPGTKNCSFKMRQPSMDGQQSACALCEP